MSHSEDMHPIAVEAQEVEFTPFVNQEVADIEFVDFESDPGVHNTGGCTIV